MTESNWQDLYRSAVAAFPHTTKRQHATHPIVIKNLTWVPFLGLKTLFVKGLAQNEGKEYEPLILFKNVDYQGDEVKLAALGKEFNFAKISLPENEVLVRCPCADFRWRFAWFNKLDHSLYGRPPRQYVATTSRPPANPLQHEGVCKHLIKLVQVLGQSEIFL